MDEISVLADGRVAEWGSWGELMAREDGRLRALWERETAGDRVALRVG
ncbi:MULTISPECIES: hypothetical protein [Kitasatospora]|nr:hypothetical protein [Kitasatospora sp. GP30]MDH6141505.1 ABC-type transport system involved in Fe-S cluster assembly fused permease/ATPase subunit [Kitasatospora sp. GP30]